MCIKIGSSYVSCIDIVLVNTIIVVIGMSSYLVELM